ncbi:hypothetical protein F2P81_017842 [Scophthalmus maximus]|uniref:Uncharacterized protein n=1 Tax=Scophthalmus maximus TaxID=52904 RepID=A0A6A4S6L2_SCOMX|nr:hypothetical protein F2P81_017842 [Scophthalmus maximus]
MYQRLLTFRFFLTSTFKKPEPEPESEPELESESEPESESGLELEPEPESEPEPEPESEPEPVRRRLCLTRHDIDVGVCQQLDSWEQIMKHENLIQCLMESGPLSLYGDKPTDESSSSNFHWRFSSQRLTCSELRETLPVVSSGCNLTPDSYSSGSGGGFSSFVRRRSSGSSDRRENMKSSSAVHVCSSAPRQLFLTEGCEGQSENTTSSDSETKYDFQQRSADLLQTTRQQKQGDGKYLKEEEEETMDEEDEEEEDEEELSMVLNVKGLFTGSFIKVSFQAKKQSNQTFQL